MYKIDSNYDFFDFENHNVSDSEDVDIEIFLKKFRYDNKRKKKYDKREMYKGKTILDSDVFLS